MDPIWLWAMGITFMLRAAAVPCCVFWLLTGKWFNLCSVCTYKKQAPHF